MPAFFHPNQHSAAAIAQMIFDDMQDPPVQLIYENGDPVGDDDDDDDEEEGDNNNNHQEEADNGPPPLEMQEDVVVVEDLPGEPLPNAAAQHHHHHHHGNHHAAVLAHWFTAHHNHQHATAAAVLNDLNMDLAVLQQFGQQQPANQAMLFPDEFDAVEQNIHTIPQMNLFGVPADDLLILYNATTMLGPSHSAASLKTLKSRILNLRVEKPQMWPRIGMGLYKRTSRGCDGGCDARILVRPRTAGGQPGIVWAHKFILGTNEVFRQLLGYNAVEDCLLDDGRVTDLDMPSITVDAMRTVVMATYDVPVQKLSLDLAQDLEYWAMRFCLGELLQLCRNVVMTAPRR
ncbi:hypothetical protein BV898_12654 [Hypsibius exemplaris]|uniref:BTB domain-containing protein n=1 Tax=Hypsibius exemplaris TaxID=2072580 RepID=A0A1W0WD15_HYPEX|nr:hypothetical protein BV898_12654 [Hypsibius exemplaris]